MGETGFIDAIQAYDRLSDAMKARIEGLEVVYEFNPDFASGQYRFPEDIEALDSGRAVKRLVDRRKGAVVCGESHRRLRFRQRQK